MWVPRHLKLASQLAASTASSYSYASNASYAKARSLTCQSQSPLPRSHTAPPLGPAIKMIALDVDVHYLEYCMHGRLTIGNYLPLLWNQAFIKKSGPHSRVSRHR